MLKNRIVKITAFSLLSAMLMSGAASAYTPPTKFPDNVKFISEEQYVDMNLNIYKNKKIKDNRTIAKIKTNRSKGINVDTRVVWYSDNPELNIYVDGNKRANVNGKDFTCNNAYELTLPNYFIDRKTKRPVDFIIKCNSVTLDNVAFNPYKKADSSILSLDGNRIWVNGLKSHTLSDFTLELRYNDTGKLYNKDVFLSFKDLDTAAEGVKMGSGFDGRYFVPGISKEDWRLREADSGFLFNGTGKPDDETFKTGFAYYIHNGKISLKSSVRDAGFEIGGLSLENYFGNLKIVKER